MIEGNLQPYFHVSCCTALKIKTITRLLCLSCEKTIVPQIIFLFTSKGRDLCVKLSYRSCRRDFYLYTHCGHNTKRKEDKARYMFSMVIPTALHWTTPPMCACALAHHLHKMIARFLETGVYLVAGSIFSNDCHFPKTWAYYSYYI